MRYAEIRPAESPPEEFSTARLPGCKSSAQRALLLAANTGGITLRGARGARDTEVLANALADLGVELRWRGDDLEVASRWPERLDAAVRLAENGTALRTLPLVVAMLGGRVEVTGHADLGRRPLDELLAVLEQLGVRPASSALPLCVDGRAVRVPPTLEVRAERTTQPATGALLGLAARASRGLGGGAVRVVQPAAAGYLETTVELLRVFGHEVLSSWQDGDLLVTVGDQARPAGAEVRVPRDPSAAVFPLVLAALHGRPSPRTADLAAHHPDLAFAGDVTEILRAPAEGRLQFDDLARRPDCVPALCVLAAARAGETVVRGVRNLRLKESDRIRGDGSRLAGGRRDLRRARRRSHDSRSAGSP